MIINKEEVEKAARQYIGIDSTDPNLKITSNDIYDLTTFQAGVEFSEEYVQKYVQNIIIENQGLKLYKDNEAERFKELAVEFARYIRSNPKEVKDYSLTIFEEGKFVSDDVKHYDNIEELLETFIRERNGNTKI